MLSIQETKKGGVAIVFSKEYAELGKSLYPTIAANLFGSISAPESQLPSNARTLTDVKTNVEKARNLPSKGTSQPKLKLNIPRTTTGIPKTKKEIKQSVHELIAELSTTHGLKYGIAWNKAYRLLYDATGFDVDKVMSVKVKGRASKIETVLSNGKGDDLIRALRVFLDKK